MLTSLRRTWRVTLTPPASGIRNMSLDEALLSRARRTGECVLRVYTWSTPTLSLGRNQSAHEAVEPERARAMGVDVVRRLTGGRALLHHREVTYSVTAPLAAGESVRDWYAAINALLLEALAALGVTATTAPRGERLAPPAAAPCFERPAEGEIVAGGRKLVGSALVRDRDALLQHGSILIDDDQALVTRLARVASPVTQPAATLHALLGRVPAASEVAQSLFAAVQAGADPSASPLSFDADLERDASEAAQRYADPRWTWRR